MTVKSYLQSAMAKLDASTRHAAVARARRAGILP
jgi:DNA-binding CsgD family transcriptional regulator